MIFYTKCGKKFESQIAASTTFRELTEECNGCKYIEILKHVKSDVIGCVCGSLEPCKIAVYETDNLETPSDLYIHTFDSMLLNTFLNIVQHMNGVTKVSFKKDLPDCRKRICIEFEPTSAGAAAKTIIIKSYFKMKKSKTAH